MLDAFNQPHSNHCCYLRFSHTTYSLPFVHTTVHIGSKSPREAEVQPKCLYLQHLSEAGMSDGHTLVLCKSGQLQLAQSPCMQTVHCPSVEGN